MIVVQPKTGTVALFVDLERDNARATAIATARELRALGFSVALCEDQDRILELGSPGATVEDAVLLVTIGGDGTLLRARQDRAPARHPAAAESTPGGSAS